MFTNGKHIGNVTFFKQFERYKAVIWKVAEVQ